jgi:hypothetical protein
VVEEKCKGPDLEFYLLKNRKVAKEEAEFWIKKVNRIFSESEFKELANGVMLKDVILHYGEIKISIANCIALKGEIGREKGINHILTSIRNTQYQTTSTS